MNESPLLWKLVGVFAFVPVVAAIAILERRENGCDVRSALRVAVRDWRYAFFE